MEEKTEPLPLKKRDICVFLIGLAVGCVFGVLAMLDTPASDYYSLNLTGIAGPSASSPTSPAFNFTLFVENRGLLYENCFSHGQAAVSYAGVFMGEGRVPGMCAGPGTTNMDEVKAVAHGGEGATRLTDSQRKRLKAEIRWGSAEFDVDVKLFLVGQTRGPVVLWCKFGLQESQRPSQCKAFTDLGRKVIEQF